MNEELEASKVLEYNLKRLRRYPFFLLVDDDERDLELMSREINTYFFDDKTRSSRCLIAKARDGDEALAIMSGFKADIVFVDLMLVGMSGIELIDHINQLYSPGIVVVTGHSDQSPIVAEAMKHGVVYMVQKPLTQPALGKILRPL